MGPPSPNDGVPGGRTRGGRAAGMSNDEWARQRKDNHVSPQDLSVSFISCLLGPLSLVYEHVDHLVSSFAPIPGC